MSFLRGNPLSSFFDRVNSKSAFGRFAGFRWRSIAWLGRSKALLGLGWFLLLIAVSAPRSILAVDSTWEYVPYKVKVLVSLGDNFEFTPMLRADLIEGIDARVFTSVGAPWDYAIEMATPEQEEVLGWTQQRMATAWIPPPPPPKNKKKSPGAKTPPPAPTPSPDGKSPTDPKPADAAAPAAGNSNSNSTAPTTPAAASPANVTEGAASAQPPSAPAAKESVASPKAPPFVMHPLAKSLFDLGGDKVIHLRVVAKGGGFEILAREFDQRSRTFGALIEIRSAQREKLHDDCFQAIWRVFSPVAFVLADPEGTIEVEVAGRMQTQRAPPTATVEVKASRLPLRDASLSKLHIGAMFRAMMRFNDKNSEPKRIDITDWTYLVVKQIQVTKDVSDDLSDPSAPVQRVQEEVTIWNEPKGDGSTAPELVIRCGIHTGLRSPFTARRRGRIDQLAVGVPPLEESTHLTVMSRGDKPAPMGDYEIYSHAPDDKVTTLVGRTLRDGTLVIPPAPNQGVRILLIKNGGEFLAKMPTLPGLYDEMMASVAKDDARLQVEGDITGFQENFVDSWARRAILMQRVDKLMEQQKAEEAKALVIEIQKLGNAGDLLEEIRQQREKIPNTDKDTDRKVNRLFEDTETVIRQFWKDSEANAREEWVTSGKRPLSLDPTGVGSSDETAAKPTKDDAPKGDASASNPAANPGAATPAK